MVVGGHSHSFLYTGQELPSVETPEGPYPTYVHQEGSAKVGRGVRPPLQRKPDTIKLG